MHRYTCLMGAFLIAVLSLSYVTNSAMIYNEVPLKQKKPILQAKPLEPKKALTALGFPKNAAGNQEHYDFNCRLNTYLDTQTAKLHWGYLHKPKEDALDVIEFMPHWQADCCYLKVQSMFFHGACNKKIYTKKSKAFLRIPSFYKAHTVLEIPSDWRQNIKFCHCFIQYMVFFDREILANQREHGLFGINVNASYEALFPMTHKPHDIHID